jgi:hypothetical protein
LAAVALARDPQAKRLRIGIFADSRVQPRWVVEAFDKVARSDFALVVLISIGPGANGSSPLLWKVYKGLDHRIFGSDHAEPRDLGEVLHLYFNEADEPDLLKLDLDVAFAVGELDDRRLDGIARYGVWRYYFGPERNAAEPLAGWREIVENAPVTGSGVKVRMTPGALPRLAYQSWSRTHPYSLARNRAQLLAKTGEFAWRALRELHRSGEAWLEQCKLAQEAGGGEGVSNSDVLRTLPRLGARIARRALEKAFAIDQWFIAFRWGDARKVTPDLAGYRRMLPPKDRTWADPFPVQKNGSTFLFFEELPFDAGRAHIAMSEVRRNGTWSPPVRVLERGYHLSYPFVFEDGGELWMVPETAQNQTIELYRCVDFPLRWRLERVLLDGVRLVDATLHKGADRWWMFANAAPRGCEIFDDELHLFWSERLAGPWRAHPRNPIKSDARGARPAGQLYWKNGALYRPAQICVPRYGAGLAMNRVLRLTPTEYAERQVERLLLEPEKGLLGIHTVNRAGDLTVVDAFARRRRFT